MQYSPTPSWRRQRVSLHRGETTWLQRREADARLRRRAAASADSSVLIARTKKPANRRLFCFLSRVASDRQLDDLRDEHRVLDPRARRRARELALLLEIAVRI